MFLLFQGTAQISYVQKDADWSRNMRNYHLLNPVAMSNWVLIFPSRAGQVTQQLSDALIRVGSGMGMKIAQPSV